MALEKNSLAVRLLFGHMIFEVFHKLWNYILFKGKGLGILKKHLSNRFYELNITFIFKMFNSQWAT